MRRAVLSSMAKGKPAQSVLLVQSAGGSPEGSPKQVLSKLLQTFVLLYCNPCKQDLGWSKEELESPDSKF